MSKSVLVWVGRAGFVTTLWLGLHVLNNSVFSSFAVTPIIHWLYLPAVLRLWAAMRYGWPGAFGIFVGTCLGYIPLNETNLLDILVLSIISGFSPLIAVFVGQKILGTRLKLHKLDILQLYVFVALVALFNAVPRYLYHSLTDGSRDWFNYFWPIFFGDFLGIVIGLAILMVGKQMLDFLRNA